MRKCFRPTPGSCWQQRGGFIKPAQKIEVLHGDAGGSFDEVVEARDHDQLLAAEADGDVTVVGKCRILRRGQMIDDPDERFAFVEVTHDLQQFGLRRFASQTRIDRGQDAAVHWDQMRSEDDLNILAAGVGEDLFDLRRVAVLANRVGRHPFVAFREKRVELRHAAGTAHSALGVDDDAGRFDQFRAQQRCQRENRRAGVAAGVRDQFAAGNL